MNTRKLFLEEILEEAGFTDVSVFTVVVFTNNRIEVKNHCESIKNCFLSQLPHIISECKTGMSNVDISRVASAIDNARDEGCYPLNFNAKQFKLDFATVLAELERASGHESEEEIVVTCDVNHKETETQWRYLLQRVISGPKRRNVGMAAVTVVAVVTTAINIRNHYR